MSSMLIAEYEAPDVNEPVPQPEITGSFASARLGPFHVPLGVEVSVWHRAGCVFTFVYANEEEPEASARALGSSAEVRLGSRSRKVLALRLDAPADALATGQRLFDPSSAQAWCRDLPLDRQFVCFRNAQVVAAVLDAMPWQVREEIVTALRSGPRAT